MLFSLVGLAVLVDEMLLILVAIPSFFAYLQYLIIPFEESLLATEFGQTYTDYQANTPRWMVMPMFISLLFIIMFLELEWAKAEKKSQ
jgi:protein-S-isoprenylcysteine O-methyltransferase Ste14